MPSVINGTNILLYQYNPSTSLGVAFAASTNCTFSTSVDQVEVTTTNSSSFKEYLGSQINWSISADGFICLRDYSYLTLLTKLRAKEQIVVKFQIDNDNGDGTGALGYSVFTGLANIVSLEMSGPVEGSSTYSVSLQGTGEYTIAGTEVTPTGVVVVGSNVLMFDYTATGGETTVTLSGAIGKSCISVTRGGVEVRTIGITGTPTDENVVFNGATGVITFATARPLAADEFIRAIFK
jgi:TP901-1 family phage major tail protein